MLKQKRTFILTSFLTLAALTGCQLTSGQPYKIDGFSPIINLIPNWNEAKRNGFFEKRAKEDGSFNKVFHAHGFECEGVKNRFYDVERVEGKRIILSEIDMPYSDYKAPTLPEDLRRVLEKLKAKNEIPQVQYHMSRPPRDFIAFKDGWLVAYSQGEWGGMLLWVEPNGTHRVLNSDNTNDLLEYNGLIYSAHGVDHLITDPESILIWKKEGTSFDKNVIPTPSAVRQLAAQDENVIGLLNSGIVSFDKNEVVHFRQFSYEKRLGFRPEVLGFLPSGDVYVSGENVIGIYDALPNDLEPKLFIPSDCEVIFEKTTPFIPRP